MMQVYETVTCYENTKYINIIIINKWFQWFFLGLIDDKLVQNKNFLKEFLSYYILSKTSFLQTISETDLWNTCFDLFVSCVVADAERSVSLR